MAQPISVLAAGVSGAGSPATAKVSPNTRVNAAAGPIGTIADVMTFASPSAVTGTWLVGATRVQAMGTPVVNQASTGTSIGPPPPSTPGPMMVTQGDPRVGAL